MLNNSHGFCSIVMEFNDFASPFLDLQWMLAIIEIHPLAFTSCFWSLGHWKTTQAQRHACQKRILVNTCPYVQTNPTNWSNQKKTQAKQIDKKCWMSSKINIHFSLSKAFPLNLSLISSTNSKSIWYYTNKPQKYFMWIYQTP